VHFIGYALLLVLVAAVSIGALTDRVKATSCCAVADPQRDLRMRDAFQDGAS
jgi:hypothetical protein